MPSHTRRISTACVIVLAALTGACANDANLTGPNAPRQPAYSLAAAEATAWTASGSGTVTLVSDGTTGDAVMSYAFNDNNDGVWTFTTTAAQTGTVTLPWSYSGNHGDGTATVLAFVNDVPVGGGGGGVSGAFSFTGTSTFNVNAGDTYGFALVGASPDESFTGTFTGRNPVSARSRKRCSRLVCPRRNPLPARICGC